MKRYFIVLMVILVLTSGLLAGCGQEAELGNRISNLEAKLTAAESTIGVLQQRIEQLEKSSLTEADILKTLEGENFGVGIRGLPGMGYIHAWIVFEKWFDD